MAATLMNEKIFGPVTTVSAAVRSRRSIRSYLPTPVPVATLRAILELAGRAPSGSNLQPWKVYVLTGVRLKSLGAALTAAFLSGEAGHQREYKYYTDPLFEPYLTRRRECGWGLYGTLGIAKGDRERSKEYRARNYGFFGAPVGMVFTIDHHLEQGSWLDYGMFLQTIMLAAREFGLHTCAQAAIADYAKLVRRELGIDETEMVVCGMALGYADPGAVINAFQPPRIPLDAYAKFCD